VGPDGTTTDFINREAPKEGGKTGFNKRPSRGGEMSTSLLS